MRIVLILWQEAGAFGNVESRPGVAPFTTDIRHREERAYEVTPVPPLPRAGMETVQVSEASWPKLTSLKVC